MSSGFNTDIKVGEHVFHVQTEDRGPNHPVIDTVVYQSGRILHRKSSNYGKPAELPPFSAEEIRKQVEDQHRAVIESVRGGALDAELAAADLGAQAARSAAIQIQLLNPGSWLSAGRVSLELEVSRKTDKQPQPGAQVDATIEGALRDGKHSAQSDEQGRVKIQFPLPPLGKGDLALVIQAKADAGKDEIRFSMRTREKPAEAKPQ
ncbi:MAG TPA: hypothetical protein VGD60_07390 [Candidatus Acidoferrales bacterium]